MGSRLIAEGRTPPHAVNALVAPDADEMYAPGRTLAV